MVRYATIYAMKGDIVKLRLKMVKTAQEVGISKTAELFKTSRNTVRKWLKRYLQYAEEGLKDRSRRPKRIPNKTDEKIVERVIELRKQTGYGPKRISWLLKKEGIDLSPHTIRHILDRNNLTRKGRKRRKVLYPAYWGWQSQNPFGLIQLDVKDIHDKRALGSDVVHHLRMKKLPRYQITALDTFSRLRMKIDRGWVHGDGSALAEMPWC
jgi:transposase